MLMGIGNDNNDIIGTLKYVRDILGSVAMKIDFIGDPEIEVEDVEKECNDIFYTLKSTAIDLDYVISKMKASQE